MSKNKEKKCNNEEIKEEAKKENDQCHCSNEEETGCQCSKECCSEEESHDELELLSKRLKALEEESLRSKAELMNYRKRKDEEVARTIKYAEEDILKGFLPILDNFERAISMDNDNPDDEVSKFLEGFKLIYKQVKDLLTKFGVVEMDTLNKEFDPTYHQAVVMDKDETKPSGVVLEVLQKGYMFKDKVLRTAMVKVNE